MTRHTAIGNRPAAAAGAASGGARFERLLARGEGGGAGFALGRRILESDDGYTGSNTIACDGRGGFKPKVSQSLATKLCGFRSILRNHEMVHVRQAQQQSPNVCKGQPEDKEVNYASVESGKCNEREAYKAQIADMAERSKDANFVCRHIYDTETGALRTTFRVLYKEEL